MSSISDSSGSTTWTQTSLGRVASRTQVVGSRKFNVGYGYNSAGQLIGITTPGSVNGWTWGNGSITARIYDQDGNVSSLESTGLTTYDYDDAQRVTGITDADVAGRSWDYGYDALDRLTAATTVSESHGYTYDANGNRTSESGAASAT